MGMGTPPGGGACMMGWAEPSTPKRATGQEPHAVCVVVHAETRRGVDEEFETLLKDLAVHVTTEETGCASYVVTRVMGSQERFAVHARFSAWRAFRRHAETGHLSRALPRLSALLAAPVSMEVFLEV